MIKVLLHIMRLEIQDLKELFENEISVKYISEDILIIDSSVEDNKQKAIGLMMERDFDILGFQENGGISQYIDIQGNIHTIKVEDIVSEVTPLNVVMSLFSKKKRLFILSNNQITGIVTRADLQKTPVFLFLFGILSVFEVLCTELIRKCYIGDDWESSTEFSLSGARKTFKKLKEKNEELELLDCTYLSTKLDVLSNTEVFHELLNEIGKKSEDDKDLFIKDVNELRNSVFHPRDYLKEKRWNAINEIYEKIELLIKKFEALLK